ncbi:cation:proton antiporter [Thermotoga sp. RQ7]|uniref:cation:proton antiporter n=1 Tax=Thermotoga sp. RQ7 TaxID=126738 RepID=UPI0005A31644|nr:cation:proton antiporter [Thermotoga sp. RQ7]AJG41535.1 cation:proton antiporter [Thermotoga sp. RQ7]
MIFLFYNFFLVALGIVLLSLKRKAPVWMVWINFLFILGVVFGNYRFDLTLTGEFGVHLLLDHISHYFLLLTALVFLAVFTRKMSVNLSNLLLVLLGVLNLTFVSADLFNLYVTIEAVSLLTFLLVVEGRKKVQYWSAFKYLILGTIGMNVYLTGVAILYAENGTLSISGLSENPFAASLITSGLLLRAGVFLFSMWLPQLHSEAETVISAILSGVVVKSAVYGLLRMEEIVNWELIEYFAIFSALSGAVLAFLSRDYKRTLAYSTLSQIGIVLVSPITAPVYSLAHGVSKSWLFLLKDELPGRNTEEWERLDFWTWLSLALASLSIMGFPGFSGFSKNMVLLEIHGWEKLLMEIAFAGTAATFWRFLMKPFVFSGQGRIKPYSVILAASSVVIGIFFANWKSSLESVLLIGSGLLVHLLFRRCRIERYPLEDFDSMLGIYLLGTVMMCLFSLQW